MTVGMKTIRPFMSKKACRVKDDLRQAQELTEQ